MLVFLLAASLLCNAGLANKLPDSKLWVAEIHAELDMPIEVYGDSQKLLIWLPSKHGLRPPAKIHQQQLALLGYEVWAVDLHSAYYAPLGRKGIAQFQPKDIATLISLALEQGKTSVSLFTTGRTVPVAMKALRQAQIDNPGHASLTGLLMMHPYLYASRPTMGRNAEYLPITYAMNLPVHLFSPEYSTKFARVDELTKNLRRGGAAVTVDRLMGVYGGFHARDLNKLSESDLAQKAGFSFMLDQSIQRMEQHEAPKQAVKMASVSPVTVQRSVEPNLQPYKGEQSLKNIDLLDVNQQPVNLLDYRGKTVLVNFWASWCGPCVKEIPSMVRLKKRFADAPFEILAINIGESTDVIKAFVKPFGMNFPVLLDPDSTLVKPWKLYAYPSNFLLDENGTILSAYYGALEWDSPEIIETLDKELRNL